jgi:hypothetical protein
MVPKIDDEIDSYQRKVVDVNKYGNMGGNMD